MQEAFEFAATFFFLQSETTKYVKAAGTGNRQQVNI